MAQKGPREPPSPKIPEPFQLRSGKEEKALEDTRLLALSAQRDTVLLAVNTPSKDCEPQKTPSYKLERPGVGCLPEPPDGTQRDRC